MASTYSNLKFELIGTGDQSGTWGTTTNTNLGTAIEQALVGMATISSGFVANSLTLTLTDTNAAQNARALVLNLTQALSGAGTLNVPAIQKPYMIINATGQTVTVKVTGLTGVAVPTGTRAFLYNNGTDVGEFFNYHSSLTLGTALPITSGGTGTTSTTFVNLTTNVTGTLPIANGGTGTTSTTFVNLATNVTGTLPIANGGTGTTSTTFVNLATNVTGTLPIANGGTAASTAPNARTNLGATTVGSNFFTLTNPSAITFPRMNADNTVSALSAACFRSAIGAGTGAGTVTSVSGTGTVQGLSLSGTVTGSGNITLGGSLSAVSLTTQVSGTLPVGNGGTGAATFTANNVLLGNGTSAFQVVAPGTSGNVLTSNGTTWASTAPSGSANFQEFTCSGTYTKPSGANFVLVEAWGGGGGGSSGPRSSCLRPGGGGGGGGSYTQRLFKAACVGATVTVTIGAGGSGGASRTTDNQNGLQGSVGGDTTFGSLLTAYGGGGAPAVSLGLSNAGGGAGVLSAGSSGSVTPGAPVSRTSTYNIVYGQFGGGFGCGSTNCGGQPSGWGGGSGGRGSGNCCAVIRAATPGGSSFQGGPGGGGGGGRGNLSKAYYDAAAGGGITGSIGGGAAGGAGGCCNGVAGTAGSGRQGGGGGGGGKYGAGGAGGAGGQPAGGGGGGGASYNGFNSGAGGNGGKGLVRVYTW